MKTMDSNGVSITGLTLAENASTIDSQSCFVHFL